LIGTDGFGSQPPSLLVFSCRDSWQGPESFVLGARLILTKRRTRARLTRVTLKAGKLVGAGARDGNDLNAGMDFGGLSKEDVEGSLPRWSCCCHVEPSGAKWSLQVG